MVWGGGGGGGGGEVWWVGVQIDIGLVSPQNIVELQWLEHLLDHGN